MAEKNLMPISVLVLKLLRSSEAIFSTDQWALDKDKYNVLELGSNRCPWSSPSSVVPEVGTAISCRTKIPVDMEHSSVRKVNPFCTSQAVFPQHGGVPEDKPPLGLQWHMSPKNLAFLNLQTIIFSAHSLWHGIQSGKGNFPKLWATETHCLNLCACIPNFPNYSHVHCQAAKSE